MGEDVFTLQLYTCWIKFYSALLSSLLPIAIALESVENKSQTHFVFEESPSLQYHEFSSQKVSETRARSNTCSTTKSIESVSDVHISIEIESKKTNNNGDIYIGMDIIHDAIVQSNIQM